MKNFYVTYTFETDDERKNFLAEVQEAAAISRGEEGCLRYRYFYPADSQECSLLLWEQWESGSHQEAHTKRAHFADIARLKEKYHASTKVETSETV